MGVPATFVVAAFVENEAALVSKSRKPGTLAGETEAGCCWFGNAVVPSLAAGEGTIATPSGPDRIKPGWLLPVPLTVPELLPVPPVPIPKKLLAAASAGSLPIVRARSSLGAFARVAGSRFAMKIWLAPAGPPARLWSQA